MIPNNNYKEKPRKYCVRKYVRSPPPPFNFSTFLIYVFKNNHIFYFELLKLVSYMLLHLCIFFQIGRMKITGNYDSIEL